MSATRADKSSWQPGPWQSEPDRVEFEHAGFPCLLKRVMTSGHWCGYVGVPPSHPAHGKDYDNDLLDSVSIHGGLTYADECDGDPVAGICHVPKPGEPEHAWWFGFDCAHGGDKSHFVGRDFAPISFFNGHYWTVGEVERETRKLAEQLRQVEP